MIWMKHQLMIQTVAKLQDVGKYFNVKILLNTVRKFFLKVTSTVQPINYLIFVLL